jgi:hypothetical protein
LFLVEDICNRKHLGFGLYSDLYGLVTAQHVPISPFLVWWAFMGFPIELQKGSDFIFIFIDGCQW